MPYITKATREFIQLVILVNIQFVFNAIAYVFRLIVTEDGALDKADFGRFVNAFVSPLTLARYFASCEISDSHQFAWQFFGPIFNPHYGYKDGLLVPMVIALRATLSTRTHWLSLFYTACHLECVRFTLVHFKMLTVSENRKIDFANHFHTYSLHPSSVSLAICNRELASNDPVRVALALDALPAHSSLLPSSHREVLQLLKSQDSEIVDCVLQFLLNTAKYVSSKLILTSVDMLARTHPNKDIVKIAQRVLDAVAINQKIKP